jgi:hypothetical protein
LRAVRSVFDDEKKLSIAALDEPSTQRRTANEPAPLLAVAIIPLLGVAAWFLFG